MPVAAPPIRADRVVPLVTVAGPRRRRRFDVGFGVVADSEQEQLHQLAGEILVRRRLLVLVVVEVADHRHLGGHRRRQRTDVAESVTSPQVDLFAHQHRRVDLAELAAEVAVPEEREAFLERTGGIVGHLVEPEVSEILASFPVTASGCGEHDRWRGRRHGEHVGDGGIDRIQFEQFRDTVRSVDELGPPQQVSDVRLGQRWWRHARYPPPSSAQRCPDLSPSSGGDVDLERQRPLHTDRHRRARAETTNAARSNGRRSFDSERAARPVVVSPRWGLPVRSCADRTAC